MKRFGGFPANMRFTAVPEPFLSHVLPEMSDITELKVMLTVFRLLYRKRGRVRFVSRGELAGDVALITGLAQEDKDTLTLLADALHMAVERGTLLQMMVSREGAEHDVYFLNTEADRKAMAGIESGEITLPGIEAVDSATAATPEPLPDIFSLYEANIGIITPMIADELRAAQKMYPEAWIREAIAESANQNKRKWSYISAIMERWSSEGKTDGTYRRNPKTADPDKFIKGRYGHMVQR